MLLSVESALVPRLPRTCRPCVVRLAIPSYSGAPPRVGGDHVQVGVRAPQVGSSGRGRKKSLLALNGGDVAVERQRPKAYLAEYGYSAFSFGAGLSAAHHLQTNAQFDTRNEMHRSVTLIILEPRYGT